MLTTRATLKPTSQQIIIYGVKYSRMDQAKFVEDSI